MTASGTNPVAASETPSATATRTPTATAPADTITISGTVLGPGPTPGERGLIPVAGETVYLFGCNVPSVCFNSPGAPVATVVSDADGLFEFRLPVNVVRQQLYVLVQVFVGPVKCRRLLPTRSLLPTGGGSEADATGILLDPIAEAASRLLEQAGADGYDEDGVEEVNAAVRTANATTTFGGLTLAAANDKAEATAAADPTVQMVLLTAQAPPACAGDCDDSGRVTVEELVLGVNIALGNTSLTQCAAFDKDRNLRVSVDELVTGVNNALGGCPVLSPTPSATPTATAPASTATATTAAVSPTPTTPVAPPSATATVLAPSATASKTPSATPTPTRTGGVATPPGAAVAGGGVSIVVNTMQILPSVIAGIIEGIQAGGAGAQAALDDGGAAGSCPLGGTATRSGSFPFVSFTLSGCTVATNDGTVSFTGSGSVQLTSFTINITTISFKNAQQVETRTGSATLQGSVSPALGGSCFLTAATLTLSSGTISSGPPGGPFSSVAFSGTTLVVDQITFITPGCQAQVYRLTFNGPVGLMTTDGGLINANLNQLVMNVDDRSDPTLFVIGGGMTSPCFGGAVTISTTQTLTVPDGANCPTGGTLTLTPGGATVTYHADQSVAVDTDGDGTPELTAPNCLDPTLLMCLA